MADVADGLPSERTALAWQRTALSLVGAALVVARLTYDTLGALSVVGAGTSMALAGGVLLTKMGTRARREGVTTRRLGGGRATAALSASVVVMAATELVALLAR